MRHKVTLLPGEGIGPEVSRATRHILEAAGVQIDWDEIDARAAAGSADAGGVLN
jgi:isocitrate dehydrogenase (NAD+)